MIKILQEYKIHPKLVNLIANIYSNDKTKLYIDETFITDIDISSGIRQGCNLSSLLFILVTYKIIEKIYNIGCGIKIDRLTFSSLFYMDDALLFSTCKYKTFQLINRIETISGYYGLELNKNKCYMMIFNGASRIKRYMQNCRK